MRKRNETEIRDKVLCASFTYLVKKGLDDVSLRELSKETGISMGSIYYWYICKEDLFASVAAYGVEKLSSIIESSMRSVPSDQAVRVILNTVSEHRAEFRFVFQASASALYGEAVRLKTEEILKRYAESDFSKVSCDTVKRIFSAIVVFAVWNDMDFAEKLLNEIFDLMPVGV